MPRGGLRQGAGRKPGTPNKASQQRQEQVAATGETPLDYMLKVMRDPDEKQQRRDEMAKAVAPYVHPRLSSIETNDVTPRRDLKQVDARISELLKSRGQDRVVGPSEGETESSGSDETIPTVPGHGTA